ncbi:acyl carrier protein [Paraclostridium sp. AKS46]|nr:acyl carrier protein [Paraclostridium sp. AKS46]
MNTYILEKLKTIIKETIDLDINENNLYTNIHDLDIDSLDFLKVVISIEDSLNITLDESLIYDIKNLDELISIIDKQIVKN